MIHMSISWGKVFYWYQDICPCDLAHFWNRSLSVAFLIYKHILSIYFMIIVIIKHLWPLSSGGSLACHLYSDPGHPFIMVISEDPCHSYLFPSFWQLSCHYLFLCPQDRRSGGILFLSCLSFCHPLWNFNIPYNFWTVSTRALIFHMRMPCDKTFPSVPLFFTLWPWPWSLTHYLKT